MWTALIRMVGTYQEADERLTALQSKQTTLPEPTPVLVPASLKAAPAG